VPGKRRKLESEGHTGRELPIGCSAADPTPNGGIRITGVDYLVKKADWESNPDHKGPPELFGQLFHLFDSPNRFGLDAFYTLHVWAWKDNPVGTFANWNPNVSCDAFNPKQN